MMFQDPKVYIPQMCEVQLQYGKSTTKGRFFSFFLLNSTHILIYSLCNSVSGDGRVSNWTIVKTALWYNDTLLINFSKPLHNLGEDSITTQLMGQYREGVQGRHEPRTMGSQMSI